MEIKLFSLGERIYDATALQTYLRCPKAFEYRWVRGIVPKKESEALLFGATFHKALTVWYTSHNLSQAKKVFEELPKFMEDELRTRDRGKALMEAYVKRWGDEPFKVRDIEVSFHLGMPGGSVFAGRMDMIVEWDGNVYVIDHKTGRSLGLSFFNSLRPHLQFDGYSYACKELVGECRGVIVNGIQICKSKIAFERKVSARSEEEMGVFAENFTLIVQDVERDILRKKFIRNTASCGLYGGCPYKELCVYGDDKLSGNFKVIDPEERR